MPRRTSNTSNLFTINGGRGGRGHNPGGHDSRQGCGRGRQSHHHQQGS